MNRRNFLKVCGVATAWPIVNDVFSWPSPAAAAVNRLEKWAPTSDTKVRVEWRYLAGRIVDGDQDIGFIISMSDVKVSGAEGNALTVHRQNFTGNQEFAGKTYVGDLTYDDVSATYTFKDEGGQQLVTWQWDDTAQVYKLSISTPELTLANITITPQGPMIEEGGDGVLNVGRIGTTIIDSVYHADWAMIEIGGHQKGVARIDFQGLRRAGPSSVVSNDYDHRWFAIAVDLADGKPAWISVWKIQDPDGPYWVVTIARGSDTTWTVMSFTEEDEGTMADPLNIRATAWQNIPATAGTPGSTGQAWHITAGTTNPGDLLDLRVSVLPGQFITSDTNTLASWLQEAVSLQAEGTVLGSSIGSVKMVAVESSTETSPSTEPGNNVIFLPAIFRNL
ncbi:MAG: hypothetical protein R3264_00740 [Anaerolineae bacterium]|nr:hypothetical protein [Anaerolineae bacterium]